MCGIVGLFTRTDTLRPELGALFTPMLEAMTERGPDSAGVAVYRQPVDAGHIKYSLSAPNVEFDWTAVRDAFPDTAKKEGRFRTVGRFAILVAQEPAEEVRRRLAAEAPVVRMSGQGVEMEIYKDVGAPASVAERYGLPSMEGNCMIGHTRMATESAVNLEGCHPFTAGKDLCVVHNGSYANHNTIRRELVREGIACDSWNDTEVAARYLQWRLGDGASLKEALRGMIDSFSGFFTLAIGLRDQFAVLRDTYACKPLVVAETDDYVACATEFRALARLPGIQEAETFEPMPEQIYVWSR